MTTPQSAAIVTTPHGSGLGQQAWFPFEAIKADLSQLYSNPAAVFFNTNLTYSGVSSASNSYLFMPGTTISGTATAPPVNHISPFNLFIASDTVDASSSSLGLQGLSLVLRPNAGFNGGRVGIFSHLWTQGAPSAPIAGLTSGAFYNNVAANLGGTPAAHAGGLFGINANVFTSAAATYLLSISGAELNVNLASGSSADNKFGLAVVRTSGDAVRGALDDSAISINDQDDTSTTWKYGISIGGYSKKWPCGADSTLITAQQRQVGPASSSIALYGVDWRNCTFQSGGAAFISTGFQVDPNGNTSVATEAVTGKQVLNNNAVGTYTFPANSSYIGFTGTNATTIAFTLPAAAAAIDGRILTVFTHSAVSVSSTWASSGATFVDAPATLAAASVTRFIYDHASLQWLRA